MISEVADREDDRDGGERECAVVYEQTYDLVKATL